jgi:hypothetical protein
MQRSAIDPEIVRFVGFLIIGAISSHNRCKTWRTTMQRKADSRKYFKGISKPMQRYTNPSYPDSASDEWLKEPNFRLKYVHGECILILNFSAAICWFSEK